MKNYLLFLSFIFCMACNSHPENKPVNLIFDTDMAPDYDDVGALALLHAPAGTEEVTLSNGLFKQSRSFYLNHNYIV